MNFKKLLILAAIVAVCSCQKIENPEEGVTYITADAVQAEGTKTELQGLEVYWSPIDTIALTTGRNNKSAISISDNPTKNAVFKVSQKGEGIWYAYHPYQKDLSKTKTDTCAVGEIHEIQNPTLTSFDGYSDVLLSQGLDISNREVNAIFKRLSAVVKIVYTDNTSKKDFSQIGDYVKTVSFKNGQYSLCGRSTLNLEEQSYKAHQTTKHEVIASYDIEDNFIINGSNAVYLCVIPNIITNGYTTFTLTMNSGKKYEKKITTYSSIPDKCIKLEANKLVTFNISIVDK